ncbi:terpenoid cyclases/protein prenyltransferase alpha-alpha toroid [Pilobolus umbonatus]|nr:terpenoid cyclases/protein prenyltransferase alpha-alpha toroid [Pilobolus umbonatus]
MGILNGFTGLSELRYNDDGLPTDTSIEQKRIEDLILEKFAPYAPHNPHKKSLESILLHRHSHIAYLKKAFKGLGRWGGALDASKPWVIYWVCHSLDLMEQQLDETTVMRAISTFKQWQLPSGGFGGGGDQLGHLATTYASINALAIIGTQDAYDLIDRESLYQFLMKMKQPDGSFTMNENGEIDIRGSFCALSVAALTNLLTDELTENCSEFIVRSQTYEGGIGPYPGKEAHNGYTFCGLAALQILGAMSRLNINNLINWCSSRQMPLEGGFQGRTNKLVDGCYSFWGAGDFPLIRELLQRSEGTDDMEYLFDREALQEYILLCCQSNYGGLADKPGLGADYYHTCYCLSGLSTSQHSIQYDRKAAEAIAKLNIDSHKGGIGSLMWKSENEYIVVGDLNNLLAPTHPVHNITLTAARKIIHYFYAEDIEKCHALLPRDEDGYHHQ